MLVLIGDSHTRSYVKASHIKACIFLGPGKKNNFSSIYRFFLTTVKYLRVARQVRNLGAEVGFVIGEPDIRLEAYGSWHVPGGLNTVHWSCRRLLRPTWYRKQLSRLALFLFITSSFNCKPKLLIGSGTPNAEISDASLSLNRQFSALCSYKEVLFFDPQKSASGGATLVKNEYVGVSYFGDSQDHIHLSEKISEDLDFFLVEMLGGWKVKTIARCWQARFNRQFTVVDKFGVYVSARRGTLRGLRLATRRLLRTWFIRL